MTVRLMQSVPVAISRAFASVSHHLNLLLTPLTHTLLCCTFNMSTAVRRDRRSYEAPRRPRTRPAPNSDFVEFVHRVLDICFYPYARPRPR